MMKKTLAAAAALAAFWGAPVLAQDVPQSVAASDPQSVVSALRSAGYRAELTTDNVGDPMIETKLLSYGTAILFYGCEDGANCDSLMFSVGLDRAQPTPPDMVVQLMNRFRYAAIMLDEEGDPFVQWDVYTGGGIPAAVFLPSVQQFAMTVDGVADEVFAEERANEAGD